MGDTKLLPCPFCDGPAEIDYHKPEELFLVPVSCLACGATMGGATEPEAIAAWNTRPALLAAAKYEEANPLGGPATMLEAAARRIRAGEDFHEVLADYGLLARREGEDDTARLDFIERTFSGMTNRERYLPVQMIWGKGANGRSLREACDKYMAADAARPGGGG